MTKVAAPALALAVIDRASQVHGGGGMRDDFPLAAMYARTRAMRLFDGPDEVHRWQIARLELQRQLDGWPKNRPVGCRRRRRVPSILRDALSPHPAEAPQGRLERRGAG